jgi:hypothetical protein
VVNNVADSRKRDVIPSICDVLLPHEDGGDSSSVMAWTPASSAASAFLGGDLLRDHRTRMTNLETQAPGLLNVTKASLFEL